MKKSLSADNIKKFDRSNMLEFLSDFPLQCEIAQELGNKAKILLGKKDFNKIVFVGMGGSAIGADLIRSYLYFECNIPILVFREYRLPVYIDKSSLVFVSSYSGDTEEALSAYNEAKEKTNAIIAISSGGLLKERAQRDNITFIEIPKGLPPRCALGYLSIIPLCLLIRLGLTENLDISINQMIETLERLKVKNLLPRIGQRDNIAKYIASKLYNKFVVIYSSSINFDVCAIRLRSQLAENAKVLSSSHFFPEMNHNEIMGWENPGRLFKSFVALVLRDKGIHPRLARRMDITDKIIRDAGIELIEIWSQGKDLLSRIFSLIYIGDFVSYYLAILYGIDPTPVERVTYLKKQLAES
jgi:glucose/mannose-6-phosphate isomerase